LISFHTGEDGEGEEDDDEYETEEELEEVFSKRATMFYLLENNKEEVSLLETLYQICICLSAIHYSRVILSFFKNFFLPYTFSITFSEIGSLILLNSEWVKGI
jgi:hypothetical protein